MFRAGKMTTLTKEFEPQPSISGFHFLTCFFKSYKSKTNFGPFGPESSRQTLETHQYLDRYRYNLWRIVPENGYGRNLQSWSSFFRVT